MVQTICTARARRVALIVALSAVGAPLAVAGEGLSSSVARRDGRVVTVLHRRSEMVLVPSGTFTMGVSASEARNVTAACHTQLGPAAWFCDDGITSGRFAGHGSLLGTVVGKQLRGARMRSLELPSRSVFLSAFHIDRYEATVRQYRACVAAGGCDITPLVAGDQRYLRAHWPMVSVTWHEARGYCRWRGKRLPTEAEWEKAARGTDGRRWPWGDQPRDREFNHGTLESAAIIVTHKQMLAPSGPTAPAFAPDASDGARYAARPGRMKWSEGPYGTYDQAGNVSEWVEDLFSLTGYRGLSSFDPIRKVPVAGRTERVVRGGSWFRSKFLGRTYVRSQAGADSRSAYRGFRCARTASTRR